MELRQLRYFVAVAEELHFGRAAARLLIASPSLSQQIKALERELGLVLFARSSSGTRLTSAGEQLLPLARAALNAGDEVLASAQRIAHDRATVLRLGFLSFSLTSVTRALLTEFGRAAPDVTVQLRQYEWDDPAAGLLSGQTDAALVRPPFTGSERLQMVELTREPLFVVLAEDHPLAARPSVTRKRLAEETWLETGLVTDPVFAAYWYLADVDPEHRPPARHSHATTIEEWLGEVAFGHGVNLVPASLAEQYRRPGLAFVRVEDAPHSRLALAWRRGDVPEAVEALVHFTGGPAAKVGATSRS